MARPEQGDGVGETGRREETTLTPCPPHRRLAQDPRTPTALPG
ncbi:unnamed protein product, partial [Gulo gulo]